MAKRHIELAPWLAGSLLLGLTACGQSERAELAWARAALERNPGLEIVAMDERSGVFTVRLAATNELHTVRADEIVATLPSLLPETAPTGDPAPDAPAPAGPSAVATVSPADLLQVNAATAGWTGDDEGTSPPQSSAEPVGIVPAPQGTVVAVGDTGGAAPPPDAAAGKKQEAAREGESRVLASGPGYSIRAVGKPTEPDAARREASDSGTWARGVAAERRAEPIVCQGARFMHIDNRHLVFDGNAVLAQDGCEIHITNSRISAAGLGVAAHDARVHIRNSRVEGGAGSVQASGNAHIYAQSSSFKGMMRRQDSALLHDLGDNVWN